MIKPRICAVITGGDMKSIIKSEPLADLFEIRIDMVGSHWPEIATGLHKPWIAANRSVANHGKYTGSEEKRTEELLKALSLGASYIDIELESEALQEMVLQVSGRAKCLVSHHDWAGTPPLEKLRATVHQQLAAGADICKIVTTATSVEDNLNLLKLPALFPWASVIPLAMGETGIISRILCPLAGGYLTYASIQHGNTSAPGQLTLDEMRDIYRALR